MSRADHRSGKLSDFGQAPGQVAGGSKRARINYTGQQKNIVHWTAFAQRNCPLMTEASPFPAEQKHKRHNTAGHCDEGAQADQPLYCPGARRRNPAKAAIAHAQLGWPARFIHPSAHEGDQAACAHTTRAPVPPFQLGEGVWPTVLCGVCRTVTGQSFAPVVCGGRDGWG